MTVDRRRGRTLNPNQLRLSVDLPKELKQRLVTACIRHGLIFKDLIVKAIEEKLDRLDSKTK
jgi:hypothetical protein